MRLRIWIPAIAAALSLGVSSCSFTGVNSQPLPFAKGGGEDATTITVQMQDSVNLVPNSEVKVNDVTVGSVRRMDFNNWHATLTIGLDPGAKVPANAVARVGQKSLLGAEYLELAPPPDKPAQGTLQAGSDIGLERTGRYPETEELLASLSLVLNGGGLDQVKTITTELNKALNGRETDTRELIDRIGTFVGGLNVQRDDLVRALGNLDHLAGTLAEQKGTLSRAIDTVPQGLRSLDEERSSLVTTMSAVSNFGDVADRVLNGSQDRLVANLRNIQPALGKLADAGKALPESFEGITYPFPVGAIKRAFKGDYINLFAEVNLTLPNLDKQFLTGTPLEGALTSVNGLLPKGVSDQAVDPLRAPILPGPLPGLAPAPPAGPAPALPVPQPELPKLPTVPASPNEPSSPPAPTGAPAPVPPAGGVLGGVLNPLLRGGGG